MGSFDDIVVFLSIIVGISASVAAICSYLVLRSTKSQIKDFYSHYSEYDKRGLVIEKDEQIQADHSITQFGSQSMNFDPVILQPLKEDENPLIEQGEDGILSSIYNLTEEEVSYGKSYMSDLLPQVEI